ncbi:hypothetical protein [Mesorhizobium sp. 10J20-29]
MLTIGLRLGFIRDGRASQTSQSKARRAVSKQPPNARNATHPKQSTRIWCIFAIYKPELKLQPSFTATFGLARAMMEREVKPADTYAERVKKLIPAEVSAAFLAINAMIPLDDDYLIYVIGFFVALVLISIVYLRALEQVKSAAQIGFVSLVAFPAWALSISVDRFDFMQNKLFLASGILVLVTLIIPLILKNPKP